MLAGWADCQGSKLGPPPPEERPGLREGWVGPGPDPKPPVELPPKPPVEPPPPLIGPVP